MRFITASIFFLSYFSCPTAFGQDRHYVWSDQFGTVESGELEIESYSGFNVPSLSIGSRYYNQTFELEYYPTGGISLGASQTFGTGFREYGTTVGQSTIEGRYRIAGPGDFFAVPVICVEYSQLWGGPASDGLETKLVLEKNDGRFGIIVNGAAEYEFPFQSEVEPEFSAGFSYEFREGISSGLEFFVAGSESRGIHDAELRGTGLGPTFAFSTPWVDIACGISFGMANGADRLRFRAIADIDL